jgi:lipopolysaccharide transport system ATP-binding protein
VEGLSKRYRIGKRVRTTTLGETLSQAARAPAAWVSKSVRRFVNGSRPTGAENPHIWALRDASFELAHGQVLGIIGRNGAGKSTLLKILSRIVKPTEGRAVIRGRVGSLLEVGTGFHPELSGRENIYLNGAILGMMRAEIVRKFDAIVEFSGVEQFIDTPVKRYSSGMYVRLAFAVAAFMEPEILLVDEVLSVGDAAFQQRCLGKIGQIVGNGRTVVFVSHNMAAVRSLCSRAILLDGGRVQADGSVESCIQKYLSDSRPTATDGLTDLATYPHRSGSGTVRVVRFAARRHGGDNGALSTGTDTEFVISYRARHDRPLIRLAASIGVVDALGNAIFGCATGFNYRDFADLPPSGEVVCLLRKLPLIPGEYTVNLTLKDDQGVADNIDSASRFMVENTGNSDLLNIPSRRWGNVIVPHEWQWRAPSCSVPTDAARATQP